MGHSSSHAGFQVHIALVQQQRSPWTTIVLKIMCEPCEAWVSTLFRAIACRSSPLGDGIGIRFIFHLQTNAFGACNLKPGSHVPWCPLGAYWLPPTKDSVDCHLPPHVNYNGDTDGTVTGDPCTQLSINQRIDKASFYMFLLCGYPQRSTIVVSSHFGCHPSREMLHQLAHTFFLVPTTSGLLWPVGRPGDTAAWDWEGLPILCFQRPAPFHQDCWKPMCLKTRHAYKKNGNRMANTCKYKDQIW